VDGCGMGIKIMIIIRKIAVIGTFIFGELLIASLLLDFIWFDYSTDWYNFGYYSIRISFWATILLLLFLIFTAQDSKPTPNWRIVRIEKTSAVLLKIILFFSIPLVLLSILGFNSPEYNSPPNFIWEYLIICSLIIFALIINIYAVVKRDIRITTHSMILYCICLLIGNYLVIPIIFITLISLIIVLILEQNKKAFIKQCLKGIFRKKKGKKCLRELTRK
jgi:hypothetical protein